MHMHKFKKSLGQNFIRDEGFLASLISELGLGRDDVVVEVGAGEGSLTKVLARQVERVVTYEVDKSLEEALDRNLAGFENVEVRFEDGLRASLEFRDYKVVANVPYYITTPLIFKFLADTRCREINVLVQREVADRIVAKPNVADYGALSVAVQSCAGVRKVRNVTRTMFYPVPKVDSAFIQIVKKDSMSDIPPLMVDEALLKGLFSQRRKTIENGLMRVFSKTREEVRELLISVNISPTLRPDAINVEEYQRLNMAINSSWKKQ